MYIKLFKPLFDFVIGSLLFIITLPIFIIIAVLLGVSNKGKTFFIQGRPGKNGRIFKIIKFKTMMDLKYKDGNFLPDVERLTKIGRLVRKTSLDELPQLINVIKGDISLVGPRPLLVEYLPLYNDRQKKRHNVRPGITGWAQINGRNLLNWHEKFELDIWYVDNISFSLDLKILIRTIVKVIRADGINSSQSFTMEAFTGNN
jgi:undecaprenyl phosphate N,N'-diacetylbacillosamine 1-phosphate transferase